SQGVSSPGPGDGGAALARQHRSRDSAAPPRPRLTAPLFPLPRPPWPPPWPPRRLLLHFRKVPADRIIMLQRAAPPCSARLAMVALAAALLAPLPAAAQDAAKGTAVTVLRATKACFAATVEVAGVLIPRSEVPVGAPRDGLKLTEVLADPGDLV